MLQEPLHIIIVNDFGFVNGGAGKVALDSAKALSDRGHRVGLFCGVGPVSSDLKGRDLQIVCTDQKEIISDPNRFRAAAQGIWNSRAADEMNRMLNGYNSSRTIVHIHGWTKALSSAVIHVALKRGFKVVITLHDYFIACPNGGFIHHSDQTICRRRPMSLSCMVSNCDRVGYSNKLWRVARHFVQDKVGNVPRGVKYFISLGEFSEGVLRPFLPDGAKLFRVLNPIQVSSGELVDVEQNDGFVFVGRLSPEKGIQLLVQAGKIAECQVKLVGDGEERDRALFLNPGIEITGWLSSAGVADRLKSARALVLPSLLYEVSPLVIWEAAALGIPAIVPDTCAARDMVEDGVTGLWFRGGDMQDLAAKMRLLKNPATAARMGEAAYKTYWSNPCTMERHVDSLEHCYYQVISDNTAVQSSNSNGSIPHE